HPGFARAVFSGTPATVLSPLSLHDALPICPHACAVEVACVLGRLDRCGEVVDDEPADARLDHLRHRTAAEGDDRRAARHRFDHEDRKSTRLNSSHVKISYAVFCLKKKIQKY